MIPSPSFKLERELHKQGFTFVAGADEAGCGAWAGPVFASAVILPLNSRIKLIRDSKLLSINQRELVYESIIFKADWAIGQASVDEIDELNIRQASFLATRRAVKKLKQQAEILLSDGFQIPSLDIPCKAIIRGDKKVKSIAAASIIAKVSRDRYMRELHISFPEYGFDRHVGYGTRFHQGALIEFGPCEHHRKSYKPIKGLKLR